MSHAAEELADVAARPRTESTRPAALLLDGRVFGVLVGLFAVSGAMGLVDQVCFSKYLSTVFGATAYAVSAVLAAFMAGLMLGAHLGGRVASRLRTPLLAYGLAELLAAATIALSPVAFEALTPAYVELASRFGDSLLLVSLLRWGLAVLVVVVPTTALGMTLPLLAPMLRAADQRLDTNIGASRLNVLYAANTFGGALGALAAAYVLLPAFGLRATLYLAASTTAALGIVALVLAKALGPRGVVEQAPAGEQAPHSLLRTRRFTRLHAIAALSGAVVFIAEVVSTHLLAVVIGNSAYAFALILAIFLSCLFAGAALAPQVARRFGDNALSLSLLAASVATLVTLPLWDRLPFVFGALGGHVSSFEGRELVRASVAFGILFVPTLLMGLTFPLLLRSIAARDDVAHWVGSLTVSNTLGAVAGSLVAGYVMIPSLGSENSLRAVAVAMAMTGTWLMLPLNAPRLANSRNGPARHPPRPGATRWLRHKALLALFGVGGVAVVSPRWDLARLTSGSNVYFDHYRPPKTVAFVREDVHGGITTITEDEQGVQTLFTNGKFQGNDAEEMHAQRYFAHYPSLFVNDFNDALVIGLGTGTTLGTYTGYPWQAIEVVEISPSIVQAARDHFSGPNRAALDDPRVRLRVDDGRNYLLTHPKRFDLIGMELSSVWFAGAAALYSVDFYELVSKHLRPGGIFQQWVQLHHIEEPVFATILNTLRESFDHVVLFYGGGQGILIASNSPLRAPAERLHRLQRDIVAQVLPAARPLPSLLADALLGPRGIDAFVKAAGEKAGLTPNEMLSSDDNARLEYDTPRGNVLPWSSREAMVKRLTSFQNPDLAAQLRAP
jgi:spermidine synthase